MHAPHATAHAHAPALSKSQRHTELIEADAKWTPRYIIQAAALVGETSGMPKYDEAWRARDKWPW